MYIALLRGINVGGRNTLPMKELAQCFVSLGMEEVKTYIASGNVLFSSADPIHRDVRALGKYLEEALYNKFQLEVPVLVKTAEEIGSIYSSIPPHLIPDKTQKTDVVFLWPNLDNPEILHTIPIRKGIDRVTYVSGAIIWNIDRFDQNKTYFNRLPQFKEYQQMTIRNANTVKNLYRLLNTQHPTSHTQPREKEDLN